MSSTTTRLRVTSGAALALIAVLVAAPAYAEPSATASPTTSPTASPTSSTSTATATATESTTSAASAATKTAATSTAKATTGSVAVGGSARVYGLMAAAGATTSTDPAQIAGGYVARALHTSGGYFWTEYGGVKYADYGLTLDAVLALDAAGVGQDAARAATTYVANHVTEYVGDVTGGEQYAGALAKALNVAVAQQVDPAAFGGVDLVHALQALENGDGRFSDQSAYGDYSNTFGQSFGVLGLERAGVGASANAVAYLKAQQCPAGGFRLLESGTACTDDAAADPDSTSLAVQALIAASGAGDAAVVRGLDWLASVQKSDGSFGGGATTTDPNANSTGLAGQALLSGGRTTQARKAVTFLTGLQYGCSFPAALRGGIAYNAASFAAQKAKATKAVPDDQDRRSTTQAALALAGTPLGVVTSSGAVANAPTLGCASAPSSSTTTRTSTQSGSASQQAAALPTSVTDAMDPASAGGSLPRTGADVLGPLSLGLLLLVIGAVAVVGARRRPKGAHQ